MSPASYAGFLRAVNLGGKRKASSAELGACLEELGFEDVATFRTSGNLVFSTGSKRSADRLRADLEAGLEGRLGFAIPVYLRTAAQVRAIARFQPFDAKQLGASKGKLQVALLPSAPKAAARRQALALGGTDDPLAIRGSELYWLPSGGTLDSELDRKSLEELIGPTTMRTMGTIEQLAAKFFG